MNSAKWTPTGHNMQNYEIIVIDDNAMLEKNRRHKIESLRGISAR